jgi:hypothetical protein
MKRRTLLSALSAAFAVGALGLPQAASAAEVTLTYAFFAPAKTFPAVQMAHWAQQLNKRSNGKVEVKTFPGGTLLGAKDMYDGVTKGVADIGLGSPSYDPGRFPLTSGVALPVGFTSATQASKTLWALTKEFKPKEYEGFKVIAMFTTEPGFIQSKTAVKSAADLAGMKLRAAGAQGPRRGANRHAHAGSAAVGIHRRHQRHHDFARSAAGFQTRRIAEVRHRLPDRGGGLRRRHGPEKMGQAAGRRQEGDRGAGRGNARLDRQLP